MALAHPAQLVICHQKIESPVRSHLRGQRAKQFCSLPGYAWCNECAFYVCDIHLVSRHDAHDAVVEYPDNGQETQIPRGV